MYGVIDVFLCDVEIIIPAFKDFLEKLECIQTKLDSLTQSEKDRWLNNDKFCSLLNISHKTAQSYRDKGLVEFSQIGNKIHYRMSDIDSFLDNHKKGGFHGKFK